MASVAPITAVISDVLEELSPPVDTPQPAKQLCLRACIFLASALFGVAVFDHLDSLQSLVGGVCSISTSLVLPSACHLRLCWRDLGPLGRLADGAIVVLGSLMLVYIVYSNAQHLQ